MGMSLHQRLRFESDVARLRRLVNRVPACRTTDVDGHPVMVDTLDNVVVRFEGPWAPDMHRFFTHFGHDALVMLLGLVEDATGTSAENSARRFLDSLRLPEDRTA
ncbi:hypothetical protein AB0I60_04900 [Actinosynnema sp. NPDC050436]|uniref:hypothetical protein n=1 Tax=Actinosynnema sp. NPDC050436 TaxID=3155659 RepID=UPI0033F69153